jgi:hypothetical protein
LEHKNVEIINQMKHVFPKAVLAITGAYHKDGWDVDWIKPEVAVAVLERFDREYISEKSQVEMLKALWAEKGSDDIVSLLAYQHPLGWEVWIKRAVPEVER